jgi:AcrR family transcriptional regulator
MKASKSLRDSAGGGRPRRASPAQAEPAATPLARTLIAQTAPPRVGPLDVFALARQKWLEGERLDIGRIAKELGVGRATVFRWVGSREQLYAEILSASYAEEFKKAREEAVGVGADLAANVTHRVLKRLHRSEALRRFIAQDPEYALKVLTSSSSPVQRRAVEVQRAWFAELAEAGQLEPALDVETLAYIVVRIGEAFLYGDTISERKPEFAKATAAVRILLAAKPSDVR